jgi:hypothetical protein
LEGTPNTYFTPKNNDDVQVKKRGRKTERKGKDKKKKWNKKMRENQPQNQLETRLSSHILAIYYLDNTLYYTHNSF